MRRDKNGEVIDAILTDKTRHRPTGNPLAGRAAVGEPLLSSVPALVPVSAGIA